MIALVFPLLASAQTDGCASLTQLQADIAGLEAVVLSTEGQTPDLAQQLDWLEQDLECQRQKVPPELLLAFGRLQVIHHGLQATLANDEATRKVSIQQALGWLAFQRTLDPTWTLVSLPALDDRLRLWSGRGEEKPPFLQLPPAPAKTRLIINGVEAPYRGPGPAYLQVIWPGDKEIHQSELVRVGETLTYLVPPVCTRYLPEGTQPAEGCPPALPCPDYAPANGRSPKACGELPPCPAVFPPGQEVPLECRRERPSGENSLLQPLPLTLLVGTGASAAVGLTGLGLQLEGRRAFVQAEDPETLTAAFNREWIGGGLGVAGAVGVSSMLSALLFERLLNQR